MLGEIVRLRAHTRRAWASPWFALLCFGSVTLVAAGALATLGPTGMAAVWGLAGGGALLLTHRFYRRAGRRAGVTGHGRLAMRWSVGAFVVCFLAAAIAGHASGRENAVVVSIVVVLAAYLAFGSWQRRADAPITVTIVALPALGLCALSCAPWIVELTFGAGLIAAGALLRIKPVRS